MTARLGHRDAPVGAAKKRRCGEKAGFVCPETKTALQSADWLGVPINCVSRYTKGERL